MTPAAQPGGSLMERVRDQFEAAIINAVVTITNESSVQRTAVTDEEGRYTFSNLPPGKWMVRVEARGFASFQQSQVEILTGRRTQFDAHLAVGFERHEVTVDEKDQLSTDADENRSALVLLEAELEMLPDDPQELSVALQALAGVSKWRPNHDRRYA